MTKASSAVVPRSYSCGTTRSEMYPILLAILPHAGARTSCCMSRWWNGSGRRPSGWEAASPATGGTSMAA
jgi:hypothetical protein